MNEKKQFIEDNVNLVYYLVRRYYPAFSRDDDIIQCGMVGLCKAAEKWNGSSKFSYYAKKWILGEINQELRSRNKHKVEISLERMLEENERNDY